MEVVPLHDTPVHTVDDGSQGSTLGLAWLCHPCVMPVHPGPLVARYRFTSPWRSVGLTAASAPGRESNSAKPPNPASVTNTTVSASGSVEGAGRLWCTRMLRAGPMPLVVLGEHASPRDAAGRSARAPTCALPQQKRTQQERAQTSNTKCLLRARACPARQQPPGGHGGTAQRTCAAAKETPDDTGSPRDPALTTRLGRHATATLTTAATSRPPSSSRRLLPVGPRVPAQRLPHTATHSAGETRSMAHITPEHAWLHCSASTHTCAQLPRAGPARPNRA
jgi:hypothetical protein